MQYLVVVALIVTVYFLYIRKKPIKRTTTKNREKTTKPQSNDMVECSACGIYCEVDDSILSNGKYYCSDECLGKA